MATYTPPAAPSHQDVVISPETLADGTLAQRLDPHNYPQLGISYAEDRFLTPYIDLVIEGVDPDGGGDVTLTATMHNGVSVPITGTVEFFDGAVSLDDPVDLEDGVAVLEVTLAAGDHDLTAEYSGDANNATTTSTESEGLVPDILLEADDETPGIGVAVTLTATLSSASALEITGTVEFFDGVTSLGAPVVLVAEAAELEVAAGFTAGAHTITAVYGGDDDYEDVTSDDLIITAS